MAEKRIHIHRRLSLASLTLAWLTVFAVPVILLQVSLDYLFELTLQANRQAAVATLAGEMNTFRRDLSNESFLERKLKAFFAGRSQLEGSPATVLNLIQQATGLKIAGLVVHGSDTLEVDSIIDPLLQKEIPAMPRAMMRRYLVAVNRQIQYDFIDSAARSSVSNLYRQGDFKKVRKDADTFLRRQFGLIAEVPLEPGLIFRTVSAKLGGSAFFFYHPFIKISGTQKSIAGGCLLIMRGCDLNQRQIFKDALALQAREVKRSFSRLAVPLGGNHRLTRQIITRYYADANGQHLVSTLPDTALVDLIQGGGFVPSQLEKVLAAIPLLRVTVPRSELQHPLAEKAWLIHRLARLFALLGAVFMLRLFFFGIDFRLGIRPKVLLGTAVLLLLPVTLLLAGLATWNQFNRVYGWYQAEELQRQYFNELYDGFSHYLAALQKHTLKICASLNADRAGGGEKFVQIMETGIKGSVASDIFLDLYDGRRLQVKSSRFHQPASPEEESGRRLVSSAILHSFDAQGNFIMNQAKGGNRDPGAVDASFANEIGSRWGRPFKMQRMNTGNRFSSAYVFNEDKYSLFGLLSFNYYDNRLMRDFISNYLRPSSRFAGIEARFYEVVTDGAGYHLVGLADGRQLQSSSMLEKVALAEDVEGFIWREKDRNLLQIRWFNDYPLVMLVGSEVFSGGLTVWFIPGMLLGYGLLLLIFVFLVFELIYLRPLREFIRVTGAVAEGNLQVAVQLQANDEFGDLKTVFTGMIQGLEQRRKLAHFVSQDVLAAVESNTDADMAPGGVRVAATVVFMQLQPGAISENISAPARLAALNQFIGEGDRIVGTCGGVIDKVIENTLMLVFRAATAGESHCLQACRAALQLAYVMRDAGFRIRAGIASGNVVSGRIGSRLGKLDYTVIGDTVNLAARLKAEAAKAGTTGLIVAPSTIRGLHGQGRVAFIERVEIKGKSREYPLYELLELR